MVVSILFFKHCMVLCFVLFCSVLCLGICRNGIALCLPDKYMVFNLLLINICSQNPGLFALELFGEKNSLLIYLSHCILEPVCHVMMGSGTRRRRGERAHKVERFREEFRVP